MAEELTLKAAQAVIAAALAHGRELGLKPLTVAVLDRGGALTALAREDGSSNFRAGMAMAKATGALGFGVSSRQVATMAQDRLWFGASMTSLGEPFLAAAGALLIKSGGAVVGAVGITGDTSDNDELCAARGIEAAGFQYAE